MSLKVASGPKSFAIFPYRSLSWSKISQGKRGSLRHLQYLDLAQRRPLPKAEILVLLAYGSPCSSPLCVMMVPFNARVGRNFELYVAAKSSSSSQPSVSQSQYDAQVLKNELRHFVPICNVYNSDGFNIRLNKNGAKSKLVIHDDKWYEIQESGSAVVRNRLAHHFV